MLNTVSYTGQKLLPIFANPEPTTDPVKLVEGVYVAGQILQETAVAGTFKALDTASKAKTLLEYDVVVNSNGEHFLGSQAANEVGAGSIYTSMYSTGHFRTADLKGILSRAALTTALTGSNNDLVFSSVLSGLAGNGITVAYVDPAGNSQALSVVVTGKAIVVNLATDSGGAITSTAAQIAAAILASAAASALVTVANAAANTGAGVVTAMAATALSGGSDTPAAITDDATGDAIIAALGRLQSGKNSDGILHLV